MDRVSLCLNILEAVTVGTPGMIDGIPGKTGSDGRNGEINYIYISKKRYLLYFRSNSHLHFFILIHIF